MYHPYVWATIKTTGMQSKRKFWPRLNKEKNWNRTPKDPDVGVIERVL